jgi:hypothetical protein
MVELSGYEVLQSVRFQEGSIGRSRRGKAPGNADAQAAQISDHFAEGGILAADNLHVLHAKLCQLDNV